MRRFGKTVFDVIAAQPECLLTPECIGPMSCFGLSRNGGGRPDGG